MDNKAELDFVNDTIKEKNETDYNKAKQTCEMMLNQGNYEFAVPLCKFYQYGLGTEKDLYKAQQILEKVVNETDSDWSKRELANIIYIRCTEDSKNCFKMLDELARKGDHRSMGMLGRAYRDGMGTEIDLEKSIINLRKAYEKGLNWAGVDLVEVLLKTPSEEHNREAITVCTKLAESGNGKCMALLGRMYRDGIGITIDKDEAKKWYRKASENGVKWAMKELLALIKE